MFGDPGALLTASVLPGVDSQGGTVQAVPQQPCTSSARMAQQWELTQPRHADKRGQSTDPGLSINTNLFSFQSRDATKQGGQQHHSTWLPEH